MVIHLEDFILDNLSMEKSKTKKKCTRFEVSAYCIVNHEVKKRVSFHSEEKSLDS